MIQGCLHPVAACVVQRGVAVSISSCMDVASTEHVGYVLLRLGQWPAYSITTDLRNATSIEAIGATSEMWLLALCWLQAVPRWRRGLPLLLCELALLTVFAGRPACSAAALARSDSASDTQGVQ